MISDLPRETYPCFTEANYPALQHSLRGVKVTGRKLEAKSLS